MVRQHLNHGMALVAVAMCAALLLHSPYLQGQEQPPLSEGTGAAEKAHAPEQPVAAQETGTPEERSRQMTKAMELAWELTDAFDGESADAADLAQRILELSPEQRERVSQLAREQAEERWKLIESLHNAYALKVGELLTQKQRELYDSVIGALKELADEASAARKEFLQAVPAAARLPLGLHASTADPTELVGLSDEKRAELERLRHAMNESLRNALLERMDSQQWKDPDTWRERRKQFREAQQKARADFNSGRNALLSAEERERLDQAEAAIQKYNHRLREARRRAAEKLLQLLEPSATE